MHITSVSNFFGFIRLTAGANYDLNNIVFHFVCLVVPFTMLEKVVNYNKKVII